MWLRDGNFALDCCLEQVDSERVWSFAGLNWKVPSMTKVEAITATTLVLATFAVVSTAFAAPPAKPVQPIELTCEKSG